MRLSATVALMGGAKAMPLVRKERLFLNSVPVNRIVLKGEDDVEYYKSVPQTDFEMLGLNVRRDLADAHCYLYRNGGEIHKEVFNWPVPPDALGQGHAAPGIPLVIRLPDTASTFSCTSTDSCVTHLTIQRERNRLLLEPDHATTIYFAAFEGGNRDWKPIPTASYLPRSA